MSLRSQTTLADTSPAAASTVVGAVVGGGFADAKSLSVVAAIRGATGGTLDVYIQTSFDRGTTWLDWAHFPQLAGAAALTTRVWHVTRDTAVGTLTTIGSDASPALAVNTILGGAWGDRFRVVYVAGVGTSLGAAQSIKLFGWG